MPSVLDTLRRQHYLTCDGAWGTMLYEAGLPAGECPETWNLLRPDAVRAVAAQYVAAGADLITTNSFGGSRFRLAAFDLADRCWDVNRAAAALAREAAGGARCVVACMGPAGASGHGTRSDQEAYDAFALQARALEDGGAGACLIETMTTIDEAEWAVRAVKENTRLEILCTFTFERMPGGRHCTTAGVTPARAAEALMVAGADIIGANCGRGPEGMADIVREMRAAAPRAPILVRPSAGMPVPHGGRLRYPVTPESLAAYVPEWVEAGACMVGGCCGTTPRHIQAVAAVVRAEAQRVMSAR